jgi:CheY-like chemotaxis protein
MAKSKILWADDEIHLLKPHLLFLAEKNYDVITAMSGSEAIELIEKENPDVVLLDENMPGISGLEALTKIKAMRPNLPVVMITKSEEEHIMEDAIGSKISDYLIKPVNPNQILLSLKKILDNKRLVSEKVNTNYQKEFRDIMMQLMNKMNAEEWASLYKKLIYWDLEIDASNDKSMLEILNSQKLEANNEFSKYIEKNYLSWVNGTVDNAPTMSHNVLKNNLFDELEKNKTQVLFLVDNLRFDQWKMISPIIEQYYKVEQEDTYFAILPTATQYARNALFAGYMPSDIEKRFPQLWKNDDDEGGKNLHEEEFLIQYLKRFGKTSKVSYNKITNLNAGKKLVETLPQLLDNELIVIVYNFVDMLSHARTDMEVIRELANDEAAYRSLTVSWFEHSPLLEMMKFFSEKKIKIHITTDHGTVHVKDPVKVVGDKSVNSNLRYKQGRMLDYNKKEVFEVKNPKDALLPQLNLSTAYIFTKGYDFFAYPNNYNYYVNYYKNTFQHGGISLEEIIVPYIKLGLK